jgi:hypothetical protein
MRFFEDAVERKEVPIFGVVTPFILLLVIGKQLEQSSIAFPSSYHPP